MYNQTGPGLANFWPIGPTEWVNLGTDSNASLVNAFSYIHDLKMMTDIASGSLYNCGGYDSLLNRTTCTAALNKPGDAAKFTARIKTLLQQFHSAFYHTVATSYGNGAQTEQVLALWIGACDAANVSSSVLDYLVNSLMVRISSSNS
jgi:hypothetical protein